VNPHLLIMVLVTMGESFCIGSGSQLCKPIPSIHATTAILLIKGIILPCYVDFSCCVDSLFCEIEYHERLGQNLGHRHHVLIIWYQFAKLLTVL
jgi:hypothetical protein